MAALQCDGAGATIAAQYKALLKTNAARFGMTHKLLETEYRGGGGDWQDRFDDSMTRVYNHSAQPPAQAAVCAVAVPMLTQAASLPAGQLDRFAPAALATLDAPFVDFHPAYDRYRVDPAILMASSEVTNNGRVQVASR